MGSALTNDAVRIACAPTEHVWMRINDKASIAITIQTITNMPPRNAPHHESTFARE
jgi:hypothetical protein